MSYCHRSGGRAAVLYKFVRLSGELVCAPLLGGYLRALASLAVPQHTWALLARRDALSAHHLLSALQRYHCNLRTDLSPFSEHMHAASLGASAIVTPAARPGKMLVRQEEVSAPANGRVRGLTVVFAFDSEVPGKHQLVFLRSDFWPEVEAMIAALKLIAAVAREDPAASAAICETLQWDAVNTMFGLMCCHIPIELKAELCTTLAALGGTPATAGRVWAALEAAQLVSADRDKRALNAELNEARSSIVSKRCEKVMRSGVAEAERSEKVMRSGIESRMEEYPLTVAFLKLLISLCSAAPLPRALGAGARPAGLEPYVEYVCGRIALPAPHRTYKRPGQRRQILSLCFQLFTIWLEQYEPSPSDFPPLDREPASAPPPGYRILTQLHANTELLRLMLRTLDQAPELLAAQPQGGEVSDTLTTLCDRQRNPLTGAVRAVAVRLPPASCDRCDLRGEYLEECISRVLQILERALFLERALVTAANEAGRSVLILGLSKLILEPEVDTEDRLTTCCRILQHTATLPACASRAAALLSRALLAPAAARHLSARASHLAGRDLRHCFVECLEAEEWPEATSGAVRKAKEAVVSILQHTLPSAAPNLAHWLLGYQNTEDRSTELGPTTARQSSEYGNCEYCVVIPFYYISVECFGRLSGLKQRAVQFEEPKKLPELGPSAPRQSSEYENCEHCVVIPLYCIGLMRVWKPRTDRKQRAMKGKEPRKLTELGPTAPRQSSEYVNCEYCVVIPLYGIGLWGVSRSALHEPGVAGYPRTCFHSILDLLEAHIAGQNSNERQADDLIESCYRLVYWLCARPSTSAPALRLLRARDHFLSRHVRATVDLQSIQSSPVQSSPVQSSPVQWWWTISGVAVWHAVRITEDLDLSLLVTPHFSLLVTTATVTLPKRRGKYYLCKNSVISPVYGINTNTGYVPLKVRNAFDHYR
ncbi:hypothetical protein MSG28_000055 [Choristoneura fumiferana]|uniref:Uncharacterized protein n=1 Tax=Choristoneura fumiferana TaxID=7141 RepID=A0ACC0JZ18_CHOFU|nr:hypothetical protein MSG28_000055 [Choristoneura fumiferana]